MSITRYLSRPLRAIVETWSQGLCENQCYSYKKVRHRLSSGVL